MAKYMKTLHVPSVEGNVIYSLLEAMRTSAREIMPMVNAPVVTATGCCRVRLFRHSLIEF